METLDYDHNLMQSDEGDKKLFAIFYGSFVKDEAKSQEEGRYVAVDTVFIKIHMPGDRTNIIDRPIRPTDQYRFPQQWARYKASQEQRADGTPLSEWPIISRGQAEELKYLGFSTVEQIANASDNVSMMGLTDLKNKARVYIELAKGNTAPTEKMMAELKELSANFKVLQESHNMLLEENKKLATAKAK